VVLIEPKGTETEMTLEVIVVPVADVGGEGLLCQTTASAKNGKLRHLRVALRMSYTAALTPGEGGWICAETAEAPEPISQGRMLEEAKANVAEALGERAQVTVTPVAVAGI
jgi:hypothetical protein